MSDVVFKSPFSGFHIVPPNFASIPPCWFVDSVFFFFVFVQRNVNISIKIKCVRPQDERLEFKSFIFSVYELDPNGISNYLLFENKNSRNINKK